MEHKPLRINTSYDDRENQSAKDAMKTTDRKSSATKFSLVDVQSSIYKRENIHLPKLN